MKAGFGGRPADFSIFTARYLLKREHLCSIQQTGFIPVSCSEWKVEQSKSLDECFQMTNRFYPF